MQAVEAYRENPFLLWDVHPMRPLGDAGNDQGNKYGSFEWAKEQLLTKGLVPTEILNNPNKLIDATNEWAVRNIKNGEVQSGLTEKAAADLVQNNEWQGVEGMHRNGVMTIYGGATQPTIEPHIGLTGMKLTGPQHLVQTIYHEYMHYSGVKDHGLVRGSFEYKSWGRKEAKALGGWIDGL